MTKIEVEDIMGPPIKSDFYKNVEEWYYCRTGGTTLSEQAMMSSIDEHLVLYFHDEKLVTKTNYIVGEGDIPRGQYGSCEKFIKKGNYKEPDEIVEIRLRY